MSKMQGIQRLTWPRESRATRFVCVMLVALFAWVILASAAPLFPEASGAQTIKSKSVTVDVSHADLGYIMIRHSGTKKKLKVIITSGDSKAQYDLNGSGEYEVYPLTNGSAKYKIEVYENTSTKASSNSYTQLVAKSINVQMPDENTAFLFPNQFVWYTSSSKAVAKANELCKDLTTDAEKLDAIYNFVGKNIVYDYIKAVTVPKGYVPDVDATLASNTGICFDFSALMACMPRSQGIPTRLVRGDLTAAGNVQYHAWNQIYVDGKWVLRDPTNMGRDYKESYYVAESFR